MAKIDEEVLSRQLYTIGKDAQVRIMSTRVLVIGLNGMGSEITKNIVLMNVKSVGILDNRKATLADLGANFYLKEEDEGKVIAEVTQSRFQELNTSVPITVEKRELTDDSVYNDYDIVVLCDTIGEDQTIKINELCRKHNVKMIYAVNKGVFSMIFNDFGDNFEVFDPNGEPLETYTISDIVGNTIYFVEGDFVTLTEGDEVKFEEVGGMDGLNFSKNGEKTFTITKRAPNFIEVGDLKGLGQFTKGGVATEVRKHIKLNFKPLKERLEEPGEITFTNMAKFDRLTQIHGLFRVLGKFIDKYNRTPKSHDEEDFKLFKQIKEELKLEIEENLMQIFCYTNRGFISPLDTTIGGIAAQEVLKAASGKYTPYCQFTVYDCTEILPDDYCKLPASEFVEPKPTRYAGQVDIIGNKLQQQVEDASTFVVGAGAIGCELLKVIALMGLSVGKGMIHVTDNDNIEKSNLSRQFLFRNNNINQPKSKCATEAVKKMNEAIHIKDYQLRVGPETEDIFDKKFFSSLNFLLAALDNVQARRYCDERCLRQGISMIEGGTTGTKGNTSVSVPFKTQSYSTSSVSDGQEKSIPMCTLHNFPSNIDHTIQWARDKFEGLFKGDIEPVKLYKEQGEEYIKKVRNESENVLLEKLRLIEQNGVENVPKDFKKCIEWAKNNYDQYFVNGIQKLITSFPEDAVTDEGVPFWHAPKRFPHVLKFDKKNEWAVDFIASAAMLRAFIYGIKIDMTKEQIAEYTETLPLAPVPVQSTLEVKDEIEQLLAKVSKAEIPKVTPVEFEKDDRSNHHVEFITACSNMRAENYQIEPADYAKTALIAGKIIPAMITTTAVVSGLQCMEIYKILLKKPVESFHCSFLNLATAYLDGSEPEAVKKTKIVEGLETTAWDTFEYDGNCTIQEFIDKIAAKYPFTVDSISVGSCILYCSYLPSAASKLNKTFKEVYRDAKKEEFTKKEMVLSISIEMKDGSEIDDDVMFPDIILNF